MITAILMWTGIGLAHLVIGTSIARLNLKVWKKSKRSWLSFILFPTNTACDKVGYGVDCGSTSWTPIENMVDSNDENIYKKIVAFIWPIKLAFNLIPVTIIGAFYALLFSAKVVEYIVDFIEKPVAALEQFTEQRRAKKLAAIKVAQTLPAISPPPILDRGQMEKEIDELNKQLNEKMKLLATVFNR